VNILRFPSLPFDRIHEVLGHWSRLRRFFVSKPGRPKHIFQRHDPATLLQIWLDMRQAYVRSCAAEGKSEERAARWLDAMYDERRPHREQQLEIWNRWRMKSEDPHYRVRADGRVRLHSERCAMSAEDSGTLLTRALNEEWRQMEEVERGLHRWRRWCLARAKRQLRQEAADAKRRRLEEERGERARRAAREARWRAMNRRDITVGEIMRGRAQEP